MDIALSADGHRVAEPPCHLADGLRELSLRIAAFRRGLSREQGEGREDGASPCPEILGGEIVTADIPQVPIDVRRIYGLTVSLVIEILEELVAGQFLTPPDHSGQAAVRDADGVVLATLAPEFEAKPRALDGDVLAAKRRKSIGVIPASIFLVANPYQRRLEQADHGGQHLLSGQISDGQVMFDTLADPRERLPEVDEPGVLGLVPHLTPARVIAILLAAARVSSDRLDVPVRNGTDPHIGPCRGNGEVPDAAKRDQVVDRRSVGSEVAKAGPVTHPPEARLPVGDVPKLSGAGRPRRIDGSRTEMPAGAQSGGTRHGESHTRGKEQSACHGLPGNKVWHMSCQMSDQGAWRNKDDNALDLEADVFKLRSPV